MWQCGSGRFGRTVQIKTSVISTYSELCSQSVALRCTSATICRAHVANCDSIPVFRAAYRSLARASPRGPVPTPNRRHSTQGGRGAAATRAAANCPGLLLPTLPMPLRSRLFLPPCQAALRRGSTHCSAPASSRHPGVGRPLGFALVCSADSHRGLPFSDSVRFALGPDLLRGSRSGDHEQVRQCARPRARTLSLHRGALARGRDACARSVLVPSAREAGPRSRCPSSIAEEGIRPLVFECAAFRFRQRLKPRMGVIQDPIRGVDIAAELLGEEHQGARR